MSKSRLQAAKKAAEKVIPGNRIETTIPAGLASAGPPLGPMLGLRGINIAAFCKDYNLRTSLHREGVPLPTRIKVNPYRSYEMEICAPTTTFLLKQAAGINRAAMKCAHQVAGKVTIKHIYEIALIKRQDRALHLTPLNKIVEMFVKTALSMGIQVVRDLDAEEYGKFLEERRQIVDNELAEIQEKREAKLLRK